MNNRPQEISPTEWDELLSTKDFLDIYALESPLQPETKRDFIDWVFGVKFNYMEDGPGYAGDLFLFMGGVLESECTVVVYRDRNKALKILRPWS